MSEPSSVIDPKLFREVLGNYPTGVAVVTGRTSEGELLALVVGTFSSVSLDPPLVSFMPMKSSRTFERLRGAETICINLLSEQQEDLVSTISRRHQNKFEGLDWYSSPNGDPVLKDSVAWIDTRIVNVVEAGDHWIALCAVDGMAVARADSPLLFFQGGYGGFVSTSLMARMDHDISEVVAAVEAIRPCLDQLAARVDGEASLLTMAGRDELAQVISAVGPGVSRDGSMSARLPMTPPIGDSIAFSWPEQARERWLAKARNAGEDAQRLYRERLEYVREHGHLLSYLPSGEAGAYDEVTDATERFASGRLTPAEQRAVHESITQSSVDYSLKQLEQDAIYDVASLVVPVCDAVGEYTLTLRLTQLPHGSSGAQVQSWIREAHKVKSHIEAELAAQREAQETLR